MRTVFVLFDSLCRRVLQPYGGKRIKTPNFDRLAARSTTFDAHYVGSLPCIPARRDIQTGRLSFLHRSWGPLEPFDNSFPEILSKAGVYTHLVTDHIHYFEDGGCTYHPRYDSFEFIRGQEGDAWLPVIEPDWGYLKTKYHHKQVAEEKRHVFRKSTVNRETIKNDDDFPAVQVFKKGLEFLNQNQKIDNWFLQIETFDPHPPFLAPKRFREGLETDWRGPIYDHPHYGRSDELREEDDELRANYLATVAFCDHLLGQLLDAFDAGDLWRDTALVVSTDHGFLLGEHDFWGQNRMVPYQEIVHIPLFVHTPGSVSGAGRHTRTLTQAIDLAPTFLSLHGIDSPGEMLGRSLLPTLAEDRKLRDAAIFGYFGGAVNLTDGRFTYHRYPPDVRTQEIFQYTLMPTHIFDRFTTDELAEAKLAAPFSFTKGVPVLKVPVIEKSPMYNNYGPGALIENDTRLYDLAKDPGQEKPLEDGATEARLKSLMRQLMVENDAPQEALVRIEL